MKKIFSIILAGLFITNLCSCSRIVTAVLVSGNRIKAREIREVRDTVHGKDIVIIGTHHVGSPRYYSDVRRRLDSLRSAGYVVFFEGVGTPASMDSLSRDTLERKMRRVLGAYVGPSYADRSNKSTRRYAKRYVAQTMDILGLDWDSPDCIMADLTMSELIRRFEMDKGGIALTDYDWETPLKSKYKRRKSGDKKYYDRGYMIHSLREHCVIRQVYASDSSRIVLLYGFTHFYPLQFLIRDRMLEDRVYGPE